MKTGVVLLLSQLPLASAFLFQQHRFKTLPSQSLYYAADVDLINKYYLSSHHQKLKNGLLALQKERSEEKNFPLDVDDGLDEEYLFDFNEGVKAETAATKASKAKAKVRKASAKEKSGYLYSDADGEYDVPIIEAPMWFRMSVRKSSEKKLCDQFKNISRSDERWSSIITDAYFPQVTYAKFKGKALELATKPLVPGYLYLKTKMGPDIADAIEKVQGVYSFTKSVDSIVLPLSEADAEQLENMINKTPMELTEDLKLMRKEEYVSVVHGQHSGRYGILMAAKNGRLEVCLRSEFKDDWELFEPEQLRYLAEPPEKKWKTMTAKEAVESLMAKDPKNPTIRAMRNQGLLEEILYPDGRPRENFRERREERLEGRDGGRSQRSIAKERPSPGGFKNQFDSPAVSDSSSSSRGDSATGRREEKSYQRNVDSERGYDDYRFERRENERRPSVDLEGVYKSLSEQSNERGAGISDRRNGREIQYSSFAPSDSSSIPRRYPDDRRSLGRLDKNDNGDRGVDNGMIRGANKAGDMEDIDNFIENLLSGLDSEVSSSQGQSAAPLPAKKWNPVRGENVGPYSQGSTSMNGQGRKDQDRFGGKADPRQSKLTENDYATDDMLDELFGELDSADEDRKRKDKPSLISRASSQQQDRKDFGGLSDESSSIIQDLLDEMRSASNRENNSRQKQEIDKVGGGKEKVLWSKGRGQPSVGEMEKILDGTDFSIDDLFSTPDLADDISGSESGRNFNIINDDREKKAWRKNEASNDNDAAVAPKMEDFKSFENYLDALVNFERQSSSITTGGSKPPTSTNKNKRYNSFSTSGNNNYLRDNFDEDTDSEIFDLLDESDLNSSGADSGESVNKKTGNVQGSSKNRRTDSPAISKTEKKWAVDQKDDLESFFDSLNFDLQPSVSKEDSIPKRTQLQADKASSTTKNSSGQIRRDSEALNTRGEQEVSDNLSALKVPELKAMLKAKALPVSGNKAEMIERLQKYK